MNQVISDQEMLQSVKKIKEFVFKFTISYFIVQAFFEVDSPAFFRAV